MIPPRLIAYGLAGLALTGSLWWLAHQVSQWRAAYQERPALVARIRSLDDARKAVESDLLRQTDENRRIELETASRLASATADARDLARRLRAYEARRAAQDCPAAAAPVPADGASGGAASPGEVDAALASYLEAAGRDSERLTSLQEWTRGLPKVCVIAGE